MYFAPIQKYSKKVKKVIFFKYSINSNKSEIFALLRDAFSQLTGITFFKYPILIWACEKKAFFKLL